MIKAGPQYEIEELRARLAEAEDALAAIREGRVDAIVVAGSAGPQVFSLAGAETIYRRVVETMGEAAINVSPDGIILFGNERFCEFVATPMQELLGQNLSRFVAPEDQAAFRVLLSQCGAQRVKGRITFCGPDGARTPALLIGNALMQGDSLSLCFVAADLTELESSAQQIEQLRLAQAELRESRRAALKVMEEAVAARREAEQATAALRESEERLQATQAGAPIGLVETTLDGRYLSVNHEFCRIVGYPRDELLNLTFAEVTFAEDVERNRELFRQLIAGEISSFHIEKRFVRKDGSLVWVEANRTLVRDAAGQPLYVVGAILDITERKQAEEALREADRRKDEFLAMLAHELRNPLAPIRNAAQVLKLTGPANAEQQWAREVIECQTQHLARLVDDLLDVSRITLGKITLQREPLELATIIQRAVEASHPLVDARRHQLTVTLPPEPLHVEGDSTRLAQVVGNLLNNAAKYTDEGGQIHITAAREESEAIVCVSDDGIGMRAELVPHIFDLFTQADPSLDRSQGGLGIGLTLVKQLVELHGGRVEARSAGPGQGSEFVVRLPALVTAAMPDAAASASERAPLTSSALRILVVEDNADSAQMMAFMLTLDGHEVQMAYDGEVALSAARAFQPQVILCDIGLPVMDGYEVARQLRAKPEFRQTRIIALSGYGQEEDRRRSQEAGFDYHLIKPVEPSTLAALLDSLRQDARAVRLDA